VIGLVREAGDLLRALADRGNLTAERFVELRLRPETCKGASRLRRQFPDRREDGLIFAAQSPAADDPDRRARRSKCPKAHEPGHDARQTQASSRSAIAAQADAAIDLLALVLGRFEPFLRLRRIHQDEAGGLTSVPRGEDSHHESPKRVTDEEVRRRNTGAL